VSLSAQARVIGSAEPDGPVNEVVSNLLREIDAAIAEQLPARALKTMAFPGRTVEGARDAAVAWLRDFTAHEPLRIQSIKTEPFDGRFVAVVSYLPW
jgi:hypothetical protein